ncbi:hypothetical protein FI667_g7498, partial [Globisporangium splendens]
MDARVSRKRKASARLAIKATRHLNDELDSTARTRCLYRSKQCNHPRAMKMNGEFHKLCEYHRQRANLNQQRVHQRRKLRLKESTLLGPISASSSSANDGESLPPTPPNVDSSTSDQQADVRYFLEPCSSPCGDLPVQDLKILQALLFHSSSPMATEVENAEWFSNGAETSNVPGSTLAQ